MKNYKFLCQSDTHGKAPVPWEDIDSTAYLHAGDFHNRLYLRKSKADVDATHDKDNIIQWRDNHGKIPVHIVRGNHDCKDPYGVFNNFDLTGNVKKIDDKLFIIGIGWHGDVFYDLPTEEIMNEVVQKVLYKASNNMKDGDQSILLTHYPAYIPELIKGNGNPEGWMFNCIRNLVEALHPLAIIQGHVHELFGMSFHWQNSLFVFPGPSGGYLNITEDNNIWKTEFKFNPLDSTI